MLGNGVSALAVALAVELEEERALDHLEEPCSSSRATLQHAWTWRYRPEAAEVLKSSLTGFGALRPILRGHLLRRALDEAL